MKKKQTKEKKVKKKTVKRIAWASLSFTVLKTLAKAVGIKGRSMMNKKELVSALKKEVDASSKAKKLVLQSISKPELSKPSTSRQVKKSKSELKEPAAPKFNGEVFIDRGKPIPDVYGKDVLRLLPRDPEWLFVYWEITPLKMNELAAEYSDLHTKQWQVRLIDLTDGGTTLTPVFLGACNWYLKSSPKRKYKTELGFIDNDKFIPVLVSNEARTPSNSISERTDEEWMILQRDLMRIVRIQGESDFFGAKRPHSSGERYMDVTEEQLKLLRLQASSSKLK